VTLQGRAPGQPRSAAPFFVRAGPGRLQYLRLDSRTWEWCRRAPPPDDRVLLQDGWILRVLQGHAGFSYAVAAQGRIQSIPASKLDALLKSVPKPRLELPAFKQDQFFFLDIGSTWFPSTVYQGLLAIRIAELEQETEGPAYCFWQFRMDDRPTVERALRAYGIRIVDGTVPTWRRTGNDRLTPLQQLSSLLKEAYTSYLKASDRIHHLRNDIALDALPDSMAPQWKALTDARSTDAFARQACDHVVNRVARLYDWHQMRDRRVDSRLTGLIVDVGMTQFATKATSNHVRVFVPLFGTCLEMSTTLNPGKGVVGRMSGGGSFLSRLQMEHWRAYPYLGKLRNTGRADAMTISSLSDVDARLMLNSMASVLTLEVMLLRSGSPSNFDVASNDWAAGHRPFRRTFLATASLVRWLDRYHGRPAIVVRDALGTVAVLEMQMADFARRRSFLRGLRPGTWLRFMASSRLHENLQGTPVLHLEPYHPVDVVEPTTACQNTILGGIRAFGSLTPHDLATYIGAMDPDLPAEASLNVLEHSGLIDFDADGVQFVPHGVTRSQAQKFRKMGRGESFEGYAQFRHTTPYSILALHALCRHRTHPLLGRQLERDSTGALSVPEPKADDAARPKPWTITVRSASKFGEVLEEGRRGMVQRRAVRLRAAGRAVATAYDVADELAYEYAAFTPEETLAVTQLTGPHGGPVRAIDLSVALSRRS
jgi:hypothetical protein